MSDDLDALAAAQRQPAQVQQRTAIHRHIPAYGRLQAASVFLFVFALLLFITGGFAFAFALVNVIDIQRSATLDGAIAYRQYATDSTTAVFSSWAIGSVFYGLSGICVGVRDIARNSHR